MKKKNKSAIIISTIVAIMLVLLVVFSYLITKLMELPIDLPFAPQTVLADSDISASEAITDTWYGTIIFEPKPVIEPEVIPEPEEPELETKFDSELNLDTLENYINGHLDVMKNGVDYLFIDEVTVENRATGIKTFTGHDVYAISQADGLMIAGTTLESGSRIKMAFIHKDTGIELDVVDNLTYWEEITESARDAEALLAVNASDYTWNYAYDCGKLTGLVKRRGDLIRKANDETLTVGVTKDNDLIIGNSAEMHSGIEGNQVLVINGETVYTAPEEETREARTIIGQLKNGTLVLAIADRAGEGATVSELLNTMNAYELESAVLLSGGDRTAMYWNGRVVNELVDEDGLKLPTTWIVKSDFIIADEVEETEEETSVVEENALELD